MRNRLLPGRISALHLFLTGMLCLPAYLFQDTLWVRIVQVVIFGILARIAGKKIKWSYFLIMIVSITVFNLFTPLGRVLVRIGPVPVTIGALEQGIMKGFTIVGLVFISLFSIRADLRLPGRLGALIGLVFYYYERVLEGKKRFDVRNVIPSIDAILTSLYEPPTPAGDSETGMSVIAAGPDRSGTETTDEPESTPVRTTPAGYVFAGMLLAVMWTSLFLL